MSDEDRVDLLKLFRNYPNVIGISNNLRYKIVKNTVDTTRKCIRIYVTKKLPESKLSKDDIIPKTVTMPDGREICTDVVEIGYLRKLQLSHKDRYRPSPTAVSTSRADEAAAGTIGWWIIDSNFNLYMISNNHVWAKENSASPGDPILQPGRADGGNPERDVIATLYAFVPISYSNVNYVDLAIASPVDISNVYMSILNHGGVTGFRDAVEGETLVKYGRTTGRTQFEVIDDSATVVVGYSRGEVTFTDVVIGRSTRGIIVDGGDSGAPVLTLDSKFVGLVFAGSTSGDTVVICKQSRIVEAAASVIGRNVSILVSNSYPPFFRETVVVQQQYYPYNYSLALQALLLAGVIGMVALPFMMIERAKDYKPYYATEE
ncbi:MAG: hypothetical protein QXW20_08395 [Ignisphaera sp.]